MIENLKLHWKQTFFLGTGIVIVFFLLRLINLTIIPVFADEAIYIRWAQVMKAEPTLRFLPLSDGKQPLFMWLIIPFLKLISDPLFAGRFVSIAAGFGSLVGIFLLTLQLTKTVKTALFSALVYSVVPFAVFFDRMALADSLLAMFGVWILLLSVLLVKFPRLDLAMITGIVLGGAFLTKSPAIFFAVLIPVSLILGFENIKKLIKNFIKMIPYWLIVYGFAFAIYNILRLGPNFQMIALRNSDYVFPLSNVFFHPFDPFQSHLVEIWQWYGNLLTWPIFILGLFGIIILLRTNFKTAVLLLVWILFPLLVQSEYAKVFTARYIYFSVIPFLLFVAFAAQWFFDKSNKIIIPIVAMVLLFPLFNDYWLITNPQKAYLPPRERTGYLEEWTSGYGIKEASVYLRERAKKRKVLIGTEGYFGTLPDGLQMYLEKVPNITIIGIGLYLEKVPEPLVNSTINNEVYLLINDDRLKLNPKNYGLTLIASYPKAKRLNNTNENLLLFLVK